MLIISTYPDEESVVKVAKMMPSFFTCGNYNMGKLRTYYCIWQSTLAHHASLGRELSVNTCFINAS